MARKKMNLNHVIMIKLNDSDNKIKNEIQDKGYNITEEIRRFLRDFCKKISNNDSNM